MEYWEFLEQIRETVQKKAGEESIVRISPVLKNNRDCVDTMTILRGEGNVAPAIWMEPYFQRCREGASLGEIAEEILRFDSEHSGPETYDISFYRDFLCVRENLVCRLVNYEKNRRMLEKVPHRRFLDLAVVYYYRLEDDTFGKASILVRNEHMEMWDSDPEEIDDAAMSNTARLLPYECIYITDLLKEMMGIDLEECREQLQMYVLTNSEKSYGAADLLYGSILEAVAERIGGDYFVLPSSVHECMLVPVKTGADPAALRKMVCEINEEYVAQEEILGDSVYRYFAEEGALRIVCPQT